ncbi:uroporphyrinogen decarboxylase family protein [Fontivita pretiosa]|uniref:uroporphyrinogen decarboxylase family protein n=1 Tax=Fontivita pretiosa TaxID=2989684 RepID=UPI003D1866E2
MMDRGYYLNLAARGLAMPVGTDLVLREHADHEAILHDGARLGAVLAEAARRYGTPLALPVMDLTLEKAALLQMLGVPADEVAQYHFSQCPGDEVIERVRRHLSDPSDPRLQANIDAIRFIRDQTDLIPVGMTIGPFSLMTKLLADPITPLFMAGSGVTAADDEEVRTVERVLELSTLIILRSISRQIQAGARLIFVAEPAANVAYISPKQIEAGSDIFDRYVMRYNQRLKSLMNAWGVDLFFHCCGELTTWMVQRFTQLDPAILSLGSSRKLWEDARVVPPTTVLYGNLPSKKFYSDELCTRDDVMRMARELREKMSAVGHPFILGTECDVLSVPGCEKKIMGKVQAMLAAASAAGGA